MKKDLDLYSIEGFGPRMVGRVGEHWPRLLQAPVLRENPYLLTRVRGIGWILADRVARAMGVAMNDPNRVNAAAVYALSEAEADGHTCLPEDLFKLRLQNVLGVDLSGRIAFDGNQIIMYDGLVARRATDFAEHIVAAKFKALSQRTPSRWSWASTDDLEHIDQTDAILGMRDASIFVLNGGPGTGKTWTVKRLIKNVNDVALAAPTGKAAKRLEELSNHKAQTIHRLLGVIHPKSSEYRFAKDAHSHGFRFRHTAKRPLEQNTVVVDEASMVDIRLMADLCDALPPTGRLILVGDPFQLAAVGPGAILRDVAAAGLERAELTILKRQDPKLLIARNCQQIRYEQKITIDNLRGGDFYFLEAKDPLQAQALIVDLVTERIPKHYGLDPRREIITITARKTQGVLSAKALNIALRAKLNPDAINSVKPTVGDRVIQQSNNYDLEIMNGDIGTLLSIGASSHRFEAFDPNQDPEKLDPDNMTILFDVPEREVTSDYRNFDIDLAYALTCHKFQGSEAPAVVVAVHDEQGQLVTSAQWLYTAISRARDVCIVVGSRRNLEEVAARVREVKRYTRLAGFLRDGQEDARTDHPY